MKKVSIIIPVYNSEKFLRKCLNSVMAQTYKNIEVICIDDCSSDSSLEILKEYETSYPECLKVIRNKENVGQGRSRMRGLNIATGDYVCFVDSDDYLAMSYVTRFMYEQKKAHYDLDVIFAGFTKDRAGKLKKFNLINNDWTLLTYPLAACKMFKRSFIMDHGIDFSEIRNGEDIFFSLEVFYACPKYKIINYHGYYYFDNVKSTTRTITQDKRLEASVEGMYDIFMERHDISKLPRRKQRMLEYTYVTHMVNSLLTYGRGCGFANMKEKYDFFFRNLRKRFPDYRSNPYFGLFKPNVSLKIRLGVGVTMTLHKLGLDKLMFMVWSKL